MREEMGLDAVRGGLVRSQVSTEERTCQPIPAILRRPLLVPGPHRRPIDPAVLGLTSPDRKPAPKGRSAGGNRDRQRSSCSGTPPPCPPAASSPCPRVR